MTSWLSPTRFSGKGSGLCAKFPFTSSFSNVKSFTPNAFNKAGMAKAPVLFTTSTTIRKPAAAIAFLSTHLCFTISAICSSSMESFAVTVPRLSTVAKLNASFSASSRMALPSSALINSPLLFSSFNAFHSLGLWLAVSMIPPSVFKKFTAISTVGVVLKSRSITSIPREDKVAATRFFTMSPLIRPSRPITTFLFFVPVFFELFINQVP